MAVFHSGPAVHRRWFFLMTLLAFTLVLFAGGILWHSLETSSINEIQVRIEGMKPIFAGIRWFLIILITVTWPTIINNLHRLKRIDEAQRVAMRGQRWRVMAWLVVIELMLGQNLLGQVLAVLQGSRA